MSENRKISKEQKRYYAQVEQEGARKYIDKYSKYLSEFIGNSELVIVDIGGGSGYFSNELKEFYNRNNTNVTVSLIDYCEYDEWSLFEGINFINESAFTALEKFPDSSVDICFLNLMLHHLTMDTYRKTRAGQHRLLEIVYRKLKPKGIVCINECYYQNPVIRDISIPVVYLLSSSRIPILIKVSRKLGSKSAGVGVCFLSSGIWLKTFKKMGYLIKSNRENPWKWSKKLLIREKFFEFILSKEQ